MDDRDRGHTPVMRPILRPYTRVTGTSDPEIIWPIDAAPDTLREEPAPDTLREGPLTPPPSPRTTG